MASTADDPRQDNRVIRDPVHDYVELPLELNELLDHPLVQRLRRISQTSMCSTVYPSMNGTRFEHAIGVMHLAGRAWDSMWSNSKAAHRDFRRQLRRDIRQMTKPEELDDFTAHWADDDLEWTSNFEGPMRSAVQAAALLHDLGHPPFSHALEEVYERRMPFILSECEEWQRESWLNFRRDNHRLAFHEVAGLWLADCIDGSCVRRLPWWCVKQIMAARDREGWAATLHALISSDVDIDRMDYLARDALKSGTEFARLDLSRLVQSLEIHIDDVNDFDLGFGLRATSALETFLHGRLQYFRWVIFHPHVVAANKMVTRALERSIDRLDDGGPLNYLVPPSEDDSSIFKIACVDDSSVNEILKQQFSSIVAMPNPGRSDRELLALVKATLFRTPNWASVWKTDHDYQRLATRLIPSIRQELETVLAEAVSERDRLRRRRQPAATQQTLVDLASAWRDFLTLAPGNGDVIRFNEFCGALFAPAGSATSAEQILGETLTELCRENLTDLPFECFWLFSLQELKVVDATSEGVRVYDGSSPTPLFEVSPSVRNLRPVDDARGHFYPFVIGLDGKHLREGRFSLHAATIENTFVDFFPMAVRERFADLIKTAPPRRDAREG